MKTLRNLVRRTVLLLAGVLLGSSVLAQPQGAGLERAAAVKQARVGQLLGMQGVVGAGVGLDELDRGAVHIMVVDNVAAARMPRVLDGVPVVVQVTGEIFALGAMPAVAPQAKPTGKPGRKPGGTKIDPTGYFARPVPIGVSTGNATPGTLCSAGTIGCRVKDSSDNVYALSNNHVYARENEAQLGELVTQPGPLDTGCVVGDPKYDLGFLADFVEIDFSEGALNVVDAAIAESSTALLGNATPANGYGAPKSATVPAAVGQAVQKYGRTTALTKGSVTSVDSTVTVTYGNGVAKFDNQIVVYARKAFIKPGDSGSLLVTNPGRSPVGLLFAGDGTGRYAIANPIDDVLSALGVTIDGE